MGLTEGISQFFRTNGFAVGALATACLLIFLAVQRVYVASLALPAASAIFSIEQDTPITPNDLADAEAALARALFLGTETTMLNSQLSYLMLDRLVARPSGEKVNDELGLVRGHVEEALKRRPLDAYLWTRLAHVTYLLDGLSPVTIAALERSFTYGSQETELFRFRVSFCMREWANLPPRIKQLMHDQITHASGNPRLLDHVLRDLPDRHYALFHDLLDQPVANRNILMRLEAGILRAQKADLSAPTEAE